MGAIYLDGYWAPNLLEVIQATGVDATGWQGWPTRSRSSGGYNDPGPIAVIVHHTASPERAGHGQQFANDASYCVSASDGPVANMVLGPEGQVSVHAGGASNHAGQGGPWTTSRGVVPVDSMNSRSIGIEASNNGQGQIWSSAQQAAYVAICAALCAAYGMDPTRDVIAHYEWAGPNVPLPGRKCDPAGPSRWAPLPSGGCSAGNYWRMDAFRAAVLTGPPPEEQEPTMLQLIAPTVTGIANPAWFVRWDSGRLSWASNADTLLAARLGVAADVVAMGSDQYQRLLNDATVGWQDSAAMITTAEHGGVAPDPD
jgi:hypothetical protein